MQDTPPDQLDDVLVETAAVAASFAASTPEARAQLLDRGASALDDAVDDLVPIAQEETGLTSARLRGELARTTRQLRFLADLAVDGRCFDAVIEHADPDDPAGPRPDLRLASEPIGPVLVFAASNFPFAFSVAGGDTGAALAAGCPVVVKAHPGHPRLSDRVGALLVDAGLPVRVVHGVDTGTAALRDERIRAAAFTGSTEGGRALARIAAERDDPIPFHGELGSVNPVVVTVGAVAARGEAIVEGFVGSFTLGVGQFCTKPGLLFLPAGHGLDDALVAAVADVAPAPMLGERLRERYQSLLAERRALAGVRSLRAGDGTAPTLLATSLDALGDHDHLLAEECFGPTSIVVEYDDVESLLDVLRRLPAGLTASLHSEPDERGKAAAVLDVLRSRAGRIVHDGWPTGVAVTSAMHHGGPWPATTSPLFSSVGGNTLRRFLVPRCYQDVPDELLPPALQEANPLGIRRLVDGQPEW